MIGTFGFATSPTRCDLIPPSNAGCMADASRLAVSRPLVSRANRNFPFVTPFMMAMARSGSNLSTNKSAPCFNIRSPFCATSMMAMTFNPANFANWTAHEPVADEPERVR